MKTSSLRDVLGPVYARREGEWWAYGFRAKECHLNDGGTVHGGIMMAFADQAIGLVAWEGLHRARCVTVQLNSLFVKSASLGDFIEARAVVIRATSSLVFMTGNLSVRGETVLRADGVWKKLGGS
ncbi:uncharacterized protein (TIGR00369 family) [Bradyrhizobium sp. USDA 4509]